MKIEPFKSLSKNGEALFKDRGSKHFGFAFGIDSLEKAKQKISEIRAEHNTANHHCFAYIIESDILIKRSSDDGEPNNSSGPPILKQIEKYDLTNVLVVVVRYFGGTKLGVGGLMNAYKLAAAGALENATIDMIVPISDWLICTDYSNISFLNQLLSSLQIELLNETSAQQYCLSIRIKNHIFINLKTKLETIKYTLNEIN